MVLVTVGPDGALLDRRRVVLTDASLPTHPHRHEGSWAMGRYLTTLGARRMPLSDAVALVERVRDAAAQGAARELSALAVAVRLPITAISVSTWADLPSGVHERIAHHRAQTFADSLMYREAMLSTAEARGWAIGRYDLADVFNDAARAAGLHDIGKRLRAMGRVVGPPWQARHTLAAAAAHAMVRREASA